MTRRVFPGLRKFFYLASQAPGGARGRSGYRQLTRKGSKPWGGEGDFVSVESE